MSTNIWSDWEVRKEGAYLVEKTEGNISEIEFKDSDNKISLNGYLYIFEDKEKSDDFLKLLKSKKFSEVIYNSKTSPNFGYSSSKYWGYFRIHDKRSKSDELVLIFDYPPVDFIELTCVTDEKGTTYSKIGGDHIPIESWEINYRKPSFKLLPNTRECWISVLSSSSVQLPLYLTNSDSFNEMRIDDYILQSIYYGGLLSILVYNILLVFTTRIYSYLIYCFFLLFYALFQMFFSGIGYVHFWPFPPSNWIDKTVPFFLSLVGLSSQLFLISLLNLKKNHNKIYKFLIYIIYFHVPHTLLSLFLPYKIGIFWVFGLAMVWTVSVTSISIYLSFKREVLARYYFLAWSFFIIGSITNMLTLIGIIDRNLLTTNAQQIGSVVEFTLLSVVLGYKINLLQKETSRNLEEEVKKRTLELEHQKSALSGQKIRLERIQSFTQMIQEAPDFETMAEKIRLTFLEKYGLSFYHFYLCNTNSKKIELLRIETDLVLPIELVQELRNNSIPFDEEKSIHVAVMKYRKSIFLKKKFNRETPSPTEKLNQKLLGMKSLYFIPLINSGKVFAILSFADIDTSLQKEQNLHKLTISQREDIELLCQSIASGLYQSLQKIELENQKKSIVELNTFVKDLNESHEIDIILSKTKLYINKYFNIEHYAIGIVDKDKLYARFLDTSYNVPQEIKEKLKSLKFPITNTIGAHAFAYKANKLFYLKSINSNRITTEEKYIIDIFQFKSFIIIPLILNKKIIGFLDLFNDKKEMPLTKEQINQLSILAEQLAGIIYSSNLYQELQTQKQHLESTLSELQTTQAQLVEAEKSAALGQLISGVAHEINNPLAAIRSSAEILEMDQARILEDIPKFFQSASPEKLSLFLELQDQSSKNRRYLPSREERQRKKQIRSTFESIPFESPRVKEDIIEYISELFLEESYPKLKERFTETEALQILQMLSLFSTQKNALKNIRLSTEKSARVIFSLRKFLGTDIKGTPREIRISDLLESSLRTYDNYIQGIVQVEKDLSGDTEIVCVVDEIQQVLKNLIFNAIQSMYTSSLKKLKIVVQKVDTEPGEKRKISIEDSGMGVGEDVVQKLFTPFFTTKSRGEGIGLGLYVSKLIVEEHGGKLEYEGVEGGSRSCVRI
jgi:C4-dicarboxylate-specific signal transduction histidine kinase